MYIILQPTRPVRKVVVLFGHYHAARGSRNRSRPSSESRARPGAATASSGDVGRGLVSAPPLLITQLAMTEACLSKSRARPGHGNCVIVEDVSRGQFPRQPSLMTQFAMPEDARRLASRDGGTDAARRRWVDADEESDPERCLFEKIRYSSPPTIPRRDAGFSLTDATAPRIRSDVPHPAFQPSSISRRRMASKGAWTLASLSK
jgi:hypothetical protein